MGISMNGEEVMIWKEAVVAYFRVLSCFRVREDTVDFSKENR
jgi:hypothetical protein